MISRRTFVAGAAAALVAVPYLAWAQPATNIPRIALVARGVAVTDMTEDGTATSAGKRTSRRELLHTGAERTYWRHGRRVRC